MAGEGVPAVVGVAGDSRTVVRRVPTLCSGSSWTSWKKDLLELGTGKVGFVWESKMCGKSSHLNNLIQLLDNSSHVSLRQAVLVQLK